MEIILVRAGRSLYIDPRNEDTAKYVGLHEPTDPQLF